MAPLEESTATEPSEFDWNAHQALAERCLRRWMTGFSREDIEDALGGTRLRCLRWVARSGAPRSAIAMVVTAARREAATFVRRRRVEPVVEPLVDEAPLPDGVDAIEAHEALEELRWDLFVSIEFLRGAHGRCLELAGVKWLGDTFKSWAAAHGHTEDQVRQWWQRCRKSLYEAIRTGRVRLSGHWRKER